jgi:hypothetical protein
MPSALGRAQPPHGLGLHVTRVALAPGRGDVGRAAVLTRAGRHEVLALALAVPVQQVDPAGRVTRVDDQSAGLALLEHVEVLHRDRRAPPELSPNGPDAPMPGPPS